MLLSISYLMVAIITLYVAFPIEMNQLYGLGFVLGIIGYFIVFKNKNRTFNRFFVGLSILFLLGVATGVVPDVEQWHNKETIQMIVKGSALAFLPASFFSLFLGWPDSGCRLYSSLVLDGNIVGLEVLRWFGIPANFRIPNYNTPLVSAAIKGNPGVVEYLIEKGAKVNNIELNFIRDFASEKVFSIIMEKKAFVLEEGKQE